MSTRFAWRATPTIPGVPPEGYQGVVRVLGTVDGLKRFITHPGEPLSWIELLPGHGLGNA